MPRHARKRAESGIYHIMLRGIDQQHIFEDEEDNLKFLQILKECKSNQSNQGMVVRRYGA